MKSAPREPLEFPSRNPRPMLDPSERRRAGFLAHLASGRSIREACALTGITRSAYENWRSRVPGFKREVEAAREQHRRDVASGLHTAEAYARMLMDAVQRDEALPAALRYRAAKSILTRQGKKDWLPEPIPASAPAPGAGLAEIVEAHHAALPSNAPAAASAGPLNPLTAPASSEAVQLLPVKAVVATQTAPVSAPEFSRDPLGPPAVEAFPEAVHSVSEPARSAPPPLQSAAASPATAFPPPSRQAPHPALKFLSPYFLHKHESPGAFEKLFTRYLAAHKPATPAEEHVVLRIARQAWRLRRNEALERVVADSTVTQLRERYPEAAAPAAFAHGFLEAKHTAYTRFHERIARERRQIEAAQARLEARLLALQRQRQSAERQTRSIALPA